MITQKEAESYGLVPLYEPTSPMVSIDTQYGTIQAREWLRLERERIGADNERIAEVVLVRRVEVVVVREVPKVVGEEGAFIKSFHAGAASDLITLYVNDVVGYGTKHEGLPIQPTPLAQIRAKLTLNSK